MLDICLPALTKRKIPGNIPKKETTKNFFSDILVRPNKMLITKKGKIGTNLTKNK